MNGTKILSVAMAVALTVACRAPERVVVPSAGQWQQQHVGPSLELLVPWLLDKRNPAMSAEMSQVVHESTFLGHDQGALTVQAAYIAYRAGIVADAEKAAAGDIAGIRALPGVTEVKHAATPTSVSGLSGLELTGTIIREGMGPLDLHGFLVAREAECWQVLVMFPSNDPAGTAAWQRIREGARIVPPA